MKYKLQIGFEHEIQGTDRILNMKYMIYKLQIGFEHEIQVTYRL